nr:type II secretion system protein [Candidatus Gracilibacteria bacterium]
MKQNNKFGFTLVELLVVITILAIISVVAYQSFGGAVNKAYSGRKISDVSTIEAALQQYKSDNNFYPQTDSSGTTNLWGYNSSVMASPSNKIRVNYNGEAISSIIPLSTNGGGKIYGSGTLATVQIGAKGTISIDTLGKKYLSKDLYDPELGDIKVGTGKMIDSGIGRYVYAVFKKGTSGVWSPTNKSGTNYNIAYTVKKDGTDTYVTKIVGDYDNTSCNVDSDKCPDTLIGSGSVFLVDGQEITTSVTTSDNQGIPYALTDFAP